MAPLLVSAATDSVRAASRRRVVSATAVHAVFWLCLGNAVGLLLSLLLLAPELGSSLGALTYGRWLTVHLDVQLYGWSALPLVAMLLFTMLPIGRGGESRMPVRLAAKLADWAILGWSLALGFGVVSWLTGVNSGKLFLEWAGGARWVLAVALGVLEVVLTFNYVLRLLQGVDSIAQRVLKLSLLAGLAMVPLVLFWSASPGVYPPANPDSGGSTGSSLLGSSLGIVGVLVLLPILLELPPASARWRSVIWQTAGVLAAHFAVFASIAHGDESHHQLGQILALASLLIWWPLGARLLKSFWWPPSARIWLRALGWWAALLLLSSVLMFLPGVLERLKFTNALVAHAHLAMAGVITSLNLCILCVLTQGRGTASNFADRRSFWLWNGGCLVLLVSLTTLGGLEALDPGRLFRPDLAASLLYAVRLVAGGAMFAGALAWLRQAVDLDLAEGNQE